MKPKLIFALIVVAGAISLALFMNRSKLQVQPAGQQNQNQLQQGASKNSLEQLGPPPTDGSNTATRDAFAIKLRSLAKATDKITVGKGCAFSPAIISLKSGSALTFSNKDNIDHRLDITEETIVRAGTDSTIKATFKGPGIYGITCDGPSVVGFIDLSK